MNSLHPSRLWASWVPLLLILLSIGTASRPLEAALPEPVVAERGAHHRRWERIVPDPQPDGTVRLRTSSYVELGTHMHFLRDGQWRESKAQFQVFPGGEAVAQDGAFQLIVAPDLAQEGVIDILTPDSHRLIVSPRWLAMTDLATGQSAMIAAIKPCLGQLVADNTIVFADAFDDLHGMIRYTYQPFGIEQDVILLEAAPLMQPAEWGLNGNPANIVLEIWSEMLAAPQPDKITPIDLNGFRDVSIAFGQAVIGEGRAFSLGQEDNSIFVSKTWTRVDQRQFLIESVRHQELTPLLARLPPGAGVRNPAQAVRGLAARKAVTGRAALLAQGRERLQARDKAREKRTQTAAIQRQGSQPGQGVVIDFSILSSASGTRLRGDTTYLVTNLVVLSGAVVIDGGTVVKFANRTNAAAPRIQFTGTIDCRASPTAPAFFTGLDDDSIGQIISGSTGSPGTNRYGLRAFELLGAAA